MSLRIGTLMAAIAGALLLAASAGAGGQPPKKIDLTNPTAVNAYLSSLGIDPATVVRQTGLNNYAGPSCPGVGWTCTTSMRVVQVSAAGGQNKFDCTPGTGTSVGGETTNEATNTCVSVQGGPDNRAQCKLKDTAVPTESQRCVIEQDGQRNLALVDQLIIQNGSDTENATQTADIEQTATDRNQAQVHQDVKQDSKQVSSTGGQAQNVHQVAIVHQLATGSENFSHVHQNQDLDASGAATLQQQNVAPLPSGVSDCDLEHKPGSNPNACADVVQIVGTFVGGDLTGPGGTNHSHVHQNINEHATTTGSPSTQNQELADTGIEAHVDQENPPNVGTNLKITDQDGRQRAEGGTAQNQIIDPNCCGVGTTVGGANNLDQFHQTAIQSATLGTAAFQQLGITGDTNHVTNIPSDSPTLTAPSSGGGGSDVCIIHHDARDNTDSTNFTFKVDPCDFPVTVETRCFSASAASEFETSPGCTHSPPPGSDFSATVVTPLQSSPTYGGPIAPPDFGEPSDFPGPTFSGI
jgi:hypothetical protein